MSFTMLVLITIQCLSIILLLTESMYIFYRWKTKQHSYLFIYCLATLINNVGYLFEMMSTTSGEALMGTKFSYFGKVWIPIAFLAFILEFCRIRISKKAFLALELFHTLICAFVMACKRVHLYYDGYVYVEEGLFPHNKFGHGPLYSVYIILLVAYMINGVVVLVRYIKKENVKENKVLAYYMLASVLIDGLGFALFMSGISHGYDTTALAYAISAVFMYCALFKHNILNTVDLVKDYVVDNLADGIIAVDERNKIIYYNDPALNIYSNIIANESSIIHDISHCIEHKHNLEKGERIYRPEILPLYYEGVFKGNMYLMTDITEQQRYMMELKKQKELAEEANASKSAFLSIVSHEIRTPMNAVVGMTDLLLKDELTDKQRKYMLNIKNSGAALVMIINDILDQSKIQAGKMEIIDDPYELRPMLDDVSMIIENRIGGKPIHLIINIDEKIPQFIVGDALRLRQIFINLMNNAVKFTESGFIQFSATVLSQNDDKLSIRFGVKDSGQGIKEEDLDKLGKAFSQVDTKKNHSKEGTGLGLSISRDFIALMSGQLLVESTYGKGSEFYFVIEQGIADMHGDDCECGKCAWKDDEYTASKARILIVDDTELNLVITEEILEILEMTIDTVSSGDKAIEMVKDNHYDVIFMDYMMPGMDGVEATDHIRKLSQGEENTEKAEYFKTVPIIALTGDASERTQEMFKIAGINDLIEKPVDFERLSKLLLQYLPKEYIEWK